MKLGTRKCLLCGEEFQPQNSRGVYCSHACSNKGARLLGKQTYSPTMVKSTCQHCGKEFERNIALTESKRFCSTECFDGWHKARRVEKVENCNKEALESGRKTYVTQCKSCGHELIALRRNKMYCDMHCATEGRANGVKREVPPDKTAICLGCGKEFSRPWNFPGKMMYCSTYCANNNMRTREFVADMGEKVYLLDGGFELRFAACCERFGVPWRRYDGEKIITEAGVYIPDFIINLNSEEYVVEVKGHIQREDETIKIAHGHDNIENYMTVFRNGLEAIERDGFSGVVTIYKT